jgi:hypothetical protein
MNPITTTTIPTKLWVKIKGEMLPETIEEYSKLIMRGRDKINKKYVSVSNPS